MFIVSWSELGEKLLRVTWLQGLMVAVGTSVFVGVLVSTGVTVFVEVFVGVHVDVNVDD